MTTSNIKRITPTPVSAPTPHAPGTFPIPTRAERHRQYVQDQKDRGEALRRKLPFLSPNFLPYFYLTNGLILVGAKTGQSKSTTAANIVAGFLKSNEDKQAIVVSNEEKSDAVLQRIACVLTEVSYIDYFRGHVTPDERVRVEETVAYVLGRVAVVSEADTYNMGYLEDVLAVLEGAVTENVGIIVIDYLQTITASREDSSLDTFRVLKKLGTALKDYGRKYALPVVVLAQLKNSEMGMDFASRVQNDKHMANHAFICIEVRPDFQAKETEFIIHKDRFWGHTGKKVRAAFVGGRHVFPGDEEAPI